MPPRSIDETFLSPDFFFIGLFLPGFPRTQAACLSVVPSVSEDELLHYERMRLQFSGDGGGGGGGGGGPTRGGGGGGA